SPRSPNRPDRGPRRPTPPQAQAPAPPGQPGARGDVSRVLRLAHRLQPEQSDEALRVLAVADQAVELRERSGLDLDPLVLVSLRVLVVEVSGQIHVNFLVGETRR